MSCTLFLCWISLATLLSTVVLVTDSCSSTFGVRRREERHTETSTELPATLKTVTILPTTQTTNYSTIMTEDAPEVTSTDKTSLKDIYDHITDCEKRMQEVFCLNGGTCFAHQYPSAKVYQCECSSHFDGERCELKRPEGSYGGGMVESRIRRSNRLSSNTEPRRESHSGHQTRVTRRRGRHTRKDHRFRTTTVAQ